VSGPLDLRPLVPALIVSLTGLAVLLAQAFTPRGGRAPSLALSLAGLAGALVATLLVAEQPAPVLGGTLTLDAFAVFLHVLILGIGIVAVSLSPSYLRATGAERGEYYALLLFSVVGMLGLVSSLELISLFVALEIMSVALYGMAGLHRERLESQESALKYFITGSFSSAFFLYGVALLYGVSGSTSLANVEAAVGSAQAGPLALLGTGLLLAGFGFKIAGVPFHMWAPDVYEGAPTTVTAFMAAGVKTAAFGALLRVFNQGLPGLADHWGPALVVLALLTMLVGNLAALAQSNLKRMLAYSSVAHAGYMLVPLAAARGTGTESILFYLVGYAAVNLGGFGALAALARAGREPLTLADLAGLGQRRPLLAAALTVFLISLTGVPVSAGFVGKFYMFGAAVNAGQVLLPVVGVLMSVVSAYYYLGLVVAMYMREPAGEDAWAPVGAASGLGLALCAAVVLLLGVYPASVLSVARIAAGALR
jgi:NADH-quinone oxidoreductase subunit N